MRLTQAWDIMESYASVSAAVSVAVTSAVAVAIAVSVAVVSGDAVASVACTTSQCRSGRRT